MPPKKRTAAPSEQEQKRKAPDVTIGLLDTLADELLLHLMQVIADPRDLMALSITCTTLYFVSKEPSLWTISEKHQRMIGSLDLPLRQKCLQVWFLTHGFIPERMKMPYLDIFDDVSFVDPSKGPARSVPHCDSAEALLESHGNVLMKMGSRERALCFKTEDSCAYR